MTTQIVALIAAIIAAVASILSLWINSRLTLERERRQQLWQYDLERIRGTEELAGRIAEAVGSFISAEKKVEVYNDLIGQYVQSMGSLYRYQDINQAMRDFKNRADIVYSIMIKYDDAGAAKKELFEAFNRLIWACDLVLKKKGI